MYLFFEFNDQYFSLVKLKEEARVSGDDSRDFVRTLHCLPTMQGGMVYFLAFLRRLFPSAGQARTSQPASVCRISF